MKVFILEDDPNRIEQFRKKLKDFELVTYCDKVEWAKDHLSMVAYDVLFLDHDLDSRTYVPSEEPNTGYQLAKWLKEKGFRFKQIIIHTMNAVGSEKIYNEVKDLAPEVIVLPFPLLMKGMS